MEEQQSQQLDELLIPPLNFAVVDRGIYRSGYPNITNLPFLGKRRLKSIISIRTTSSSSSARTRSLFSTSALMETRREPFVDIPEDVIRLALKNLLDPGNHPVLIHCNKGKHRTGCLVGCLRKLQRWSLTAIFDEYRRFAGTKVRMLDQQFMELFDVSSFRGLTR
ncbi:hypothetical protein SELMODRAFT_231635 [Selaginella moellendorffii]|uniref:diphosphoinositol-polyphosphate diphosphatase n=1 Tax=Selaginella moellendorffii TaxID=88036 RepID=D8RHE3_SELML|nr:hypothetical protein SELMODRAFT_231635 [Selaginella moellendorffii]